MKSAKVGLSKLHYALLTKDDLTGVTYGVPVLISKVKSANITVASNTETDYADNGPSEVSSSLGEITLALSASSLSLEEKAMLLGHTITGGVMEYHADDTAPYVAIGFETLKGNGKKRWVWLRKGQFAEPGDENATKEANVSFQPQSLEGKFVIRDYDGKWKKEADEDHVDYVASIGTNWFTAVEGAADTTAPTVTCNIVDAATGTAVATDIVFTFNEAVQASTITADNVFLMKADGTAVAGAITIDATHEVVTFNPDSNLSATTAYIAIVTTAVKDMAGNKLAANAVVNFTTV